MSEAPLAPVGCPQCGATVSTDERFCENCGAEIHPDAASAPPSAGAELPVSLSTVTRPVNAAPDVAAVPPVVCRQCGGTVDGDGYCTTCGAKAPLPRDHFTEQPTSWVGGCCDRGVRHHRNEDAMALAADGAPGSAAVLIVCDGVSTSTDSHVASLAAAQAARDTLAGRLPSGIGTRESRAAALADALAESAERANRAVVAVTAPGTPNAPSCTFVGAVVADRLLVYGNTGDSRAYWLPDGAETLLLTEDDSVAQVRIAAGVDRDQAETGPGSHAITRWLGADAEDVKPSTGAMELLAAGWVLLCSDGLWNYASSPADLRAVVTEVSAGLGERAEDPTTLASALVDWANAQGGKDNITVALARIPSPAATG